MEGGSKVGEWKGGREGVRWESGRDGGREGVRWESGRDGGRE